MLPFRRDNASWVCFSNIRKYSDRLQTEKQMVYFRDRTNRFNISFAREGWIHSFYGDCPEIWEFNWFAFIALHKRKVSVEVFHRLLPRFTADVSIKIRPSGWFHVKVVVTKTLPSSQLTVTMAQFSHWLSIVINTISLSMVSGRLSTQDECYFNRLSLLEVGIGS